MANVNPPPQLRIPRQFLNDPETVAFFDQQRTILFQLWVKTGSGADPFSDLRNTNDQVYSSYIQDLQKQINGLPVFTIDTSGFTVDTTQITTDKVLA